MTEKKAIEILIRQKNKVENKTADKETWLFQTASYIKDFFGSDSSEFSYISRFSFRVVHHGLSNDKLKLELESKRRKIIRFLNDCIETIENKGLYKPPKKNFLSDKSNMEIILWSLPIMGVIFTAGYKTPELIRLTLSKTNVETSNESSPKSHDNPENSFKLTHDTLKINDSTIKN